MSSTWHDIKSNLNTNETFGYHVNTHTEQNGANAALDGGFGSPALLT